MTGHKLTSGPDFPDFLHCPGCLVACNRRKVAVRRHRVCVRFAEYRGLGVKHRQAAGVVAASGSRCRCASHHILSEQVTLASSRRPGSGGSREHHKIECRSLDNRALVARVDQRHTHAIASRLAAGRLGCRVACQRGLDRPSRLRTLHALLRRKACERRGGDIAVGRHSTFVLVPILRPVERFISRSYPSFTRSSRAVPIPPMSPRPVR